MYLGTLRCEGVERGDMLAVCMRLSDQIDMLRTQPWALAVIGILTAAVAGGIAWLSTSWSNRAERRNVSQREALYAAQDVAADLRKAWNLRRTEIDGRGFAGLGMNDDFALMTQLDTCISRIRGDYLKDAYIAWADYARPFFSGSDEHDRRTEEQLWARSQLASGERAARLD